MSCDKPETWFADADGDGLGDPAALVVACERPAGTASNRADCDDSSPGGVDDCPDEDADEDGLRNRWDGAPLDPTDVSGPRYGTGADGNLSTVIASDVARLAELSPTMFLGVAAAPRDASVDVVVIPSGLAVGDEIAFLNLTGDDPGRISFAHVAGFDGLKRILFEPPLDRALSVADTRVLRVPNLHNLEVGRSGLRVGGWDRASGGAFIARVDNFAAIEAPLDATGAGFLGGPGADAENTRAYPGESALGTGLDFVSSAANGGGGGAGVDIDGAGAGAAGGGGGLGSAGLVGRDLSGAVAGLGGGVVGSATGPLLLLGSGGGGGDIDANNSFGARGGDGGEGGGAIALFAREISMRGEGAIRADGVDGARSSFGNGRPAGGGGGGSGGTIRVVSERFEFDGTLSAIGGEGGASSEGDVGLGGAGGDGRVQISATYFNALGTITPEPVLIPLPPLAVPTTDDDLGTDTDAAIDTTCEPQFVTASPPFSCAHASGTTAAAPWLLALTLATFRARRRRAAAAVIAASLSGAAHAQSAGYDAHGPAIVQDDGELLDPLLSWRPQAQTAGTLGAALAGEYARGASLRRWDADAGAYASDPLADSLIGFNLAMFGSPHERVQIAASMPLWASSQGADGPNGFQVGDLRVSAPIGLVLPTPGPSGSFGLSFVPFFSAPTGAQDRWLGSGWGVGGVFALGAEANGWQASLNLGAQTLPAVALLNLRGGPRLIASGSASFAATPFLSVGLEASLRKSFADLPGGTNVVPWSESPAEGLVSLRMLPIDGLTVTAAGGLGMTRGVGGPSARALLGVSFARPIKRAPVGEVAASPRPNGRDRTPAAPSAEDVDALRARLLDAPTTTPELAVQLLREAGSTRAIPNHEERAWAAMGWSADTLHAIPWRSEALTQGSSPFSAVAFSPDGERLLIGGDTGLARVWRWRDRRLLSEYVHTSPNQKENLVMTGAWSYTGDRVVTSNIYGEVVSWNPTNPAEHRVIQSTEDRISAAVFDPTNANRVLVASLFRGAYLWTAATVDEVEVVVDPDAAVPVRGAGFSPDGTRVVVTRLGELAPEDLQDPAKRARRKGLLSVLSFDPSVGRAGLWLEEAAREVPGARPSRYIGDRVFIPSEAGRMILWTPDPRTPWIGPQRDAPGDISIRADDRLRVSDVDPTGRRVAVGTADGTLQVWSFDHPTVPLVIQAHTGPVYGVAFSPDGEHIATTSKDGSVKLWSAPTTPEALDAALWAHPAPCLDVDQRRALGFHADTAAADYARCVARRSAAP